MYILGDEVKVLVERKRIKNIYFKIDDDGNLKISCPRFTSEFEINKLIKENESSIIRMYKKYKSRSSRKEYVLYLGKKLNFIEYKKIMISGDNAFGPSIESVNNYLEKHSINIFKERLNVYIDEFGKIPDFTLKVRKMKTRWGVNNRTSKTITLNTELIHYNFVCIDYVIVHELSHFKHMDHSRAFWNEVASHYPEYKIARKELRD